MGMHAQVPTPHQPPTFVAHVWHLRQRIGGSRGGRDGSLDCGRGLAHVREHSYRVKARSVVVLTGGRAA
ncbi:MAG: hypothetical protein ACXWCY_21395 [Burkholderiales bacterium]